MAEGGNNPARILGWVFVVAVALAAALYFFRSDRDRVTVQTATASYQDILSTEATNGKVEPRSDYQAHAPAPGTVTKLFVGVGDTVKAGEPLVAMDDADARSRLAQAQAQLAGSQSALSNLQAGGSREEVQTQAADLSSAELQASQTQANFDALKRLQAKGAASGSEVSAAQQRVDEAKIRLTQLQSRKAGRYGTGDVSSQRAQVSQAQAAVSAARSAYAEVNVKSPIAGTVYAVPVAQYDYVQAGEQLVDVADLSHLQVTAYFDEPEIGKLAAGQEVKIVWDAKPNEVWHGHILQAPTTIISYNGSRNVGECLISVDDPTRDLLPNTNVTVTVTVLHETGVLSLPREALHTVGDTDYVYKIVNGRLQQTPVQVGVVNLTRVEILGGLRKGDEVALGATTEVDLSNGLRVRTEP